MCEIKVTIDGMMEASNYFQNLKKKCDYYEKVVEIYLPEFYIVEEKIDISHETSNK